MLETPKASSYYLGENGMDETMDNQQALTETEKAWMAGFFDGEGYVGMNLTKNHSAMKGNRTKRLWIIVPRMVLANTDYASIMYWKELWDKANVGVHINTQKRNNPKHKPCWKVTINGHKRCNKAIPILLEYCVTKKSALELVQEWLIHRREIYHYTLKDYKLYLEFRKMYSGKSPNDLTLRRFYESCTAPIYTYNRHSGEYVHPKRAEDFKRKVKSGSMGNLVG